MNIEHYTPMHFSRRHTSASHFFTTHIEPVLLSLLVLTGIIGSIYLFGQKFIGNENSNMPTGNQLPHASAFSTLFVGEDESPADAFDQYIKMDGKQVAGQTFAFTFLKDEKASRYVMEMGDGVRLIVTQKELIYKYEQPGKYVIELKEIKDGLLNIVGTKKIKVK
jgi:hypothetical protein